MSNNTVNGFFIGFFIGLLVTVIVVALTVGEQIPRNLSKIQPSPSAPNVRYVPVVVEGRTIIVDCDHSRVICDDEGA